jgi:hypothetical protein
MKQPMKWAVLALLLVLTYITWTQSRREHACPVSGSMTEQAQKAFKETCDKLNGVVRDGQCVCPDGSPST